MNRTQKNAGLPPGRGVNPIGAFPALLYVAMGIFSVVSNLAAWHLYRKDTDVVKGDAE